MNHEKAMQSFYSLIAQVQSDSIRGALHLWAATNLNVLQVQYSYGQDEKKIRDRMEYIAEQNFFRLAEGIFKKCAVDEVKYYSSPIPTHIVKKSVMIVGSVE